MSNQVPLNDQVIRWAKDKLLSNTITVWPRIDHADFGKRLDAMIKEGPKEEPAPLIENPDHVTIRALEVQHEADYQISEMTWDHDEPGILIWWTEHEDPDKQFPRKAWKQCFFRMDFGQLISEMTTA